MFKTIIVAVDGSERSWQALKYASNLANAYQALLVLLHAYPHTSDLRDVDGYNRLLATRKSAGEKVLSLAQQILGEPAFPLEEELLEGPAADAILTVAGTHQADLIVMGTRGMGAVKGLLFGSVATKVSHHASCSVMVVR